MNLSERERAKYQAAWERPEYRVGCHSMGLWRSRRDELFPEIFNSALDIGCGSGRLLAVWLDAGIDAWGVDITPNCLDEVVAEKHSDRLVITPLWKMDWSGRKFDFGICADVMEHIPPDRVDATLQCIADCCDEVLFKIAHVPDVCGGGDYHLTVRPPEWWMRKIKDEMEGYVEQLGFQERSGFADSLIRWKHS